ncbi:DUF2254 domain-containing protein [Yoonia sp.]|uniref:DUF2254 domain-containing protein n=1 Tax=Yoonia sp. TaxID=2212373 RepID=UPI003A4D8F94
MKSAFFFRLTALLSQIWVKVTGYSLLAVITALAAIWLRDFIPADLEVKLGADAVETVLSIVATSMLTVATFSLGIMANAISGAADGATPRATALLLEDRVSQNALATFLGAFSFSLVGIIALQIGVYEDGGRIILLGGTIVVIILIYVAFIRWVNLLRSFGRIPDTLNRIETAAEDALKRRLDHPFLDCHPYTAADDDHSDLIALCPDQVGFVQHIDTTKLQACAETHDVEVLVERTPGQFASLNRPLAYLRKKAAHLDGDALDELMGYFTLGAARTIKQDPQFGMIMLSETAARALSPAVNDPGTAIDVLRRALRILLCWDTRPAPDVKHDRIWMPGLIPEGFLRDLIRPIARDGAGIVEVQHVLQSILLDLAQSRPDVFASAAKAQSREAYERAEAGLTLQSDKDEVREIANKLAHLRVKADPPAAL